MRCERVWVWSLHKLAFLPVVAIGVIAVLTGGGALGAVILLLGIVLGAIALRPVSFHRDAASGAPIMTVIFSRKQFDLRPGDSVLYAHRPGFLRGTANLAVLRGATLDWVPGTNGTMFWKRPELPPAPRPLPLRVCGTRSFLALVADRLGERPDLDGALWWTSERPPPVSNPPKLEES